MEGVFHPAMDIKGLIMVMTHEALYTEVMNLSSTTVVKMQPISMGHRVYNNFAATSQALLAHRHTMNYCTVLNHAKLKTSMTY